MGWTLAELTGESLPIVYSKLRGSTSTVRKILYSTYLNCHRKVAYPTWEEAEKEGLRIWMTRNTRPNPATPYLCEWCQSYHLAGGIRKNGKRVA